MTIDETLLKELISDPAAHFSSPGDVLEDDRLSVQDKRCILESWLVDETELSKATEENMGGSNETQLQQVHKALARLGKPA